MLRYGFHPLTRTQKIRHGGMDEIPEPTLSKQGQEMLAENLLGYYNKERLFKFV